MSIALRYETLEKLPIGRPVDRLAWIAERCRGKAVLDIGCLDETALAKRDTEHWLHGRIAASARCVLGVDRSAMLPPEGLQTASNATIVHGDGVALDDALLARAGAEIVVAGEFIEHIESPLAFFARLREALPGREFVLSTPNGVCFANTLMGSIGREVQHHDHLHNFTYKILATLCTRAGFPAWQIVPYRFYATEMILASRGARRLAVQAVEAGIRAVERCFPLLSFGYIVQARL
jgi:hypothetical protein